ncbi:phage tail protein [Vibrio mediterranei]|uniref:phage tail-collar fiber domain-containing protein n=1 Tax=Vibrio mediterranei TaxID=689 RepID=UPI002691B836
MSQAAIPLEFEQYLQNKVSLKQPTDLNEIIFAMIPDLDLSQPIDRTVSLPPLEQWVFQQDVDQIGKSGSNAVVYSVVIPGSTEPFTFNAMFLRDKNVPNSCGMVVYKATETKETGMALTKSMLMQFDGAAAAANVTIDAATWQIDYQARLKGMEEDHRLSCLDNYGHTAFVDGFDVTRHEIDQTKYLIAPGVAYVGGLRIQNALSTVQTVDSKPTTLWVDVYRDGTALSKHENLFQIVATTDALVDYTDSENRPHYVAKLARIEADGSLVDLRVKGGLDLAELKSNAATDENIDSKSNADRHVKLPQLWRAFKQRNVVHEVTRNVNVLLPAGSPVQLTWNSVKHNPTNIFEPSSNLFRAKVEGWYDVRGLVHYTPVSGSPTVYIHALVNGVLTGNSRSGTGGAGSGLNAIGVSTKVYLLVGDTLGLYLFTTGQINQNTFDDDDHNFFQLIYKGK